LNKYEEIRKNNFSIEAEELEHLEICKNAYPYPKLGKMRKEKAITYGKELFPLPSKIWIETTSWCNFSCNFCPSSFLKREKKIMEEDLFRKIVDELNEMKWVGEVHLYGDNDPLTDPYLVDRIKYIKSLPSLKKNPLILLSNMIKLDYDLLEQLYLAGVDRFTGDRYMSDEKMNTLFAAFQKLKDKYDNIKVFDNYKFWNNTFVMKRNDFNICIYPKSEGDAKEVFGKNFNSRLSLIKTGKKLEDFRDRMCVRPFRHLDFFYDGRVPGCCQEWLYDPRNIMGDMNKNSIVEIWNGKPFMELRYNLLQYDRYFYPCSKCDDHGDPYWFACRSVNSDGLSKKVSDDSR
jgi:hypothetical protein